MFIGMFRVRKSLEQAAGEQRAISIFTLQTESVAGAYLLPPHRAFDTQNFQNLLYVDFMSAMVRALKPCSMFLCTS